MQYISGEVVDFTPAVSVVYHRIRVRELLKFVNIWPSYFENKTGALFMAHSVVISALFQSRALM